jgi:hypothetical protein
MNRPKMKSTGFTAPAHGADRNTTNARLKYKRSLVELVVDIEHEKVRLDGLVKEVGGLTAIGRSALTAEIKTPALQHVSLGGAMRTRTQLATIKRWLVGRSQQGDMIARTLRFIARCAP